jgi:PAS domain S-box-containing protein
VRAGEAAAIIRSLMQPFIGPARDAFALLLDAAPDAMVVVDSGGTVIMANAHAARLFGFEPGELLGQSIEILVPERYRRSHVEDRAGYFRSPAVRPMGAGLELFGLRKDGTEVPVEISLSPVTTESGPFAISAIRDITDRKQADAERVKLAREQAARAEAEQANRLKDEFLAMLAHELRNPLAAINTGLAILDDVGADQPAGIAARAIMGRQLRQLSRMVDDLLDVSRVSMGKIALHREPVDVAALIARCVSAITSSAGADQHEITVRTRPIIVDADPLRLEQVITNLLTNAVKYTPPGGLITVTAGPDRESAMIVVEDTGIGMTPDLVERAFELFVQGERSPARSEGGLGIGLTLVRRLVEMHGGTVEAASAGPNHGSRFTVRLPRVVSGGRVPHERRVPPTVVATKPSGRTVLVVEDNADVREMLRMLLQLQGHEVHEAADGHAGLEAAVGLRPDIALIDIGLPGMDGYELARTLRQLEGSTPLLVAVTGYGRSEDRQRMQQAGFHAHLVKPVDPERIREIVDRAPLRDRRA